MNVPTTTSEEVFSEHLPYELTMLWATEAMLAAIKDPTDKAMLCNALIEAFCLHARNLIEFFRKSSAGGRIVALDFVNGGFEPFPPPFDKTIDQLNEKINNQIAHMIYMKRTVVQGHKINAADRKNLLTAIDNALVLFKKNLLPNFQPNKLPTQPDIQYFPTRPSATNAIEQLSSGQPEETMRSITGPSSPMSFTDVTTKKTADK